MISAAMSSTSPVRSFMCKPVSWYPTPRGGSSQQWEESYRKAYDLVQTMSLTEKVNITTGTGWQMDLCVGNTGATSKFPSLCLQDGPLGLRFAYNITAFPAGITTGATWNRELMYARGAALGLEARLKGVNVLLGPAMGPLGMMPAGGRNWEGFGSDPVLQGVAAAETIRGVQRNGVMATAKHYVMNEQEHFRQPYEWGIPNAMSSNIDDRALHEVFLWPFAESVRADVASVMCAYQQVNNSHSCENSKLLNGILKDELGFQGFVQSDWLAQRSGVISALAGLDMSMPGDGLRWADGDSLWGNQLTRAVLNTSVPIERLNDMVTRIVAAWYHFRQDDWPKSPPDGKGGPNFSSWTNESVGLLHPGSGENITGVVNRFVDARGHGSLAHSLVARQVAAEGTVLLKNVDRLLPLSRTISGTYRVGIYGEDAGPGDGANLCPDRRCNQGTLGSGWGSGAAEFPYLVTPWEALQAAWNTSKTVKTQAYLTNEVKPRDLQDKDLCIVFANADAGEGSQPGLQGVSGDRPDLFLQKGGDQLIQTVATHCGKGNGKTIVVLHAVGPVIVESWADLPGVHAIIFAHLPGQESGHALADVLFGDVDASGRLPFTIGRNLSDYGANAQVLYTNSEKDHVPQVNFTSGLYIDYRHFDRNNITPRYEFGYGLSYTTFTLSEASLTPLQRKSALPARRRKNAVTPPTYRDDDHGGDAHNSLFPADFTPLHNYIYPYLSDTNGTDKVPHPFPYPDGYPANPKKKHHLSPAGGGPGGNPSLYEAVAQVSVKIKNTGSRPGKEVVQVYVSYPSDNEDETDHQKHHPFTERHGLWRYQVDFPDRVLRNFTKVELAPGQETTVQMTLSRKDLSYWSVWRQNWVMPVQGKFRIWVGKSSRDLPLVLEY
ncbi:hypothetical protein ASPZODRAFT_1206354 [Penicilliopsis zonata CBS 506.65]|uniref:Probable beta-glucosidase E n=1 Tax=Penicilliopsis zonata CBS 506.65 TaxID=1073090 RepID=A0A1L9S7C5_9EURO|nr:hypothetical protein ASPZODRAFT_1206354 [Penicilliopsis zonata CBS 506.65]OJJ43041.1 hypothetical protein ASPZODRAFT_1206354 [Penicilliopsis zonata CBS 506.65]